MKCVCITTCQTRVGKDGQIRFFQEGEVWDFAKCPDHFEPVDAVDIDFVTASKTLLTRSTSWTLDQAAEFLSDECNVDVEDVEDYTKKEMVELILDSRMRVTEV